MPNPLTNMPSVWGDLGLNMQSPAGQNADLLSEQEKMLRKKKLLAAASNPMASATQLLLGSRTGVSSGGM